jgi:predicted enzyme related to lactoylglutathione lyase
MRLHRADSWNFDHVWRKVMAHNPVGWFEIYVQDLPRARAFYEAMLEVTLEHLPTDGIDKSGSEMWAFPMDSNAPGASGALVKMPGWGSGSNSTAIYFVCDDCAVQAKRAVENGGTMFSEKTSIGPYGFVALIHDTEGNLIGLHSMS